MSFDFDKKFLECFEPLGDAIVSKYAHTIEHYEKNIIPFETKRMKENQSLSFKNTSLERDKLELLKKIEEESSENKRNLYLLERQSEKIIDLENTVSDLNKVNNDNLSVIEALKIMSAELEESLNEKIKIIKQVEQDKKQVLKDYDDKNNEYNTLLSNFMKEKNLIAEKLNYMNDLEQALLDKEKHIKEQQFYLKKQWEEFEEAKKQAKEPVKPVVPPVTRLIKKPVVEEEEVEEKEEKNKYEKEEILRNPVKKIVKHHNNEIYDLSFNYNGSMIATCGGDRTIKIYDVINFRNGVTIQSNSHDSIYLSLGLDYTGERLLAGSSNCEVQVFSTSSGKQLLNLVGHGYKVNSVSWSSAKEKCVSGSEDKQIKVWDVEKSSNILSISCQKAVKYVTCNAVEPVVYSGHSDGSVRIYSLNQNNTPITQIKGIIDFPINYVSVLSNRYQLLVSSQEGSPIHLLDLKMNKSIQKYEGKDFFNTLARAEFSPSEKFIVAGNCDGYIYYWNKDSHAFEKKVSGHEASVTSLKYHFLSNIMASCDKLGNVIIWQ